MASIGRLNFFDFRMREREARGRRKRGRGLLSTSTKATAKALHRIWICSVHNFYSTQSLQIQRRRSITSIDLSITVMRFASPALACLTIHASSAYGEGWNSWGGGSGKGQTDFVWNGWQNDAWTTSQPAVACNPETIQGLWQCKHLCFCC